MVYRGFAKASYSVRGRVQHQQIHAKFDGLGEIHLHFKPSGRTTRRFPLSGCRGAPITTHFGAFVGRLKFFGEKNYVRLNARRVRGAWSSEAKWNCRKRRLREETGDKRLRPSVSAFVARSRGRRTFFAALSKGDESLLTSFVVGAEERRGQMQIERMGLAFGEPHDYVRNQDNASVAVTPPPPFSGSALFQERMPPPLRWDGPLSVSLPGAKRLSLTGPGITARVPRHSDVQRLLELLSAF
jgi:hypothetical protein